MVCEALSGVSLVLLLSSVRYASKASTPQIGYTSLVATTSVRNAWQSMLAPHPYMHPLDVPDSYYMHAERKKKRVAYNSISF